MIFEEDQLKAKKMHELRSLLVQKGCSFTPKETKHQLIRRYLELSAITQPDDRRKPEQSKQATKEIPWLTKDEVLEAVKNHRMNGLKVSFSGDGNCWWFKLERGERYDPQTKENIPIVVQDSGTMRQPLQVIRRCADMLVRPINASSAA